MTIKEFFGDKDPLQAVKDNPEQAGELACKAVGWNVVTLDNKYFFNDGDGLDARCHRLVLPEFLPKVFALQDAVIEQVGYSKFAWHLVAVIERNWLMDFTRGRGLDEEECGRIATATAAERLTACLLALMETKDE